VATEEKCRCSHSFAAHGVGGRAGCTFCSCERFSRPPLVNAPVFQLSKQATEAVDMLCKSGDFQGVARDTVRSFVRVGKRRMFLPGTVLVRQNRPSSKLFVVLHGTVTVERVKTSRTVDEGLADQEVELVGELGTGSLVGDLSALSGTPRSTSVIANQEVEAFEIDTAALKETFAEHPELFLALTRIMSRDVDTTDELVEQTLQVALYACYTEEGAAAPDPEKVRKAMEIRARWREIREKESADDRARAALRAALDEQMDTRGGHLRRRSY